VQNIATVIDSDFNLVTVRFAKATNTYTYKSKIEGLKEGDLVIVVTPNSGPAIVEVVSIAGMDELDLDAKFEYKWIAQRVDLTAYEALIETEKKLKKAVRAAQIKRQLEEAAKEINPSYDYDIDEAVRAYKLASTRL
jgi:hypothetical protein